MAVVFGAVTASPSGEGKAAPPAPKSLGDPAARGTGVQRSMALLAEVGMHWFMPGELGETARSEQANCVLAELSSALSPTNTAMPPSPPNGRPRGTSYMTWPELWAACSDDIEERQLRMPGRQDLAQEWVELSEPWIREAREGANPTRNGLLNPPMIEACGDVRGMRVVDCGCGEGRFCMILAERGAAYVLGLDLCDVMLYDYFDETARHWKVMGMWLTNFHGSLATYVHSFLEAGFAIEGIAEPTVTEENLLLHPGLDDELRVPNFIIYKLCKPLLHSPVLGSRLSRPSNFAPFLLLPRKICGNGANS